MNEQQNALISVFDKTGIVEFSQGLKELSWNIYSSGGTATKLNDNAVPSSDVASLVGGKAILGHKVVTISRELAAGELADVSNEAEMREMKELGLPIIHLVCVDSYPLKEEIAKPGATLASVLAKTDVGGMNMLHAAAKGRRIVLCDAADRPKVLKWLQDGRPNEEEFINYLCAKAEAYCADYELASAMFLSQNRYFGIIMEKFNNRDLRYGENPHQKGACYGDLSKMFEKIHGKEISANNLGDIDAAVGLMNDIKEGIAFAIIKHCNSCGFAIRSTLIEAWKDALAGDPESAFGGIFITNTKIDKITAYEINQIFYEVIIAPEYDDDALEILMSKKDRIILAMQKQIPAKQQIKYLPNLNVMIVQDIDSKVETSDDLKYVTVTKPTFEQINDLLLANTVVKHLKSNAVALVKDNMVMSIGTGQTSRVDALKQAIEKAKKFGLTIEGAVMASEAFFPFPDCVQIAHEAGITAIIQPGGSIKDQLSIDYCNENNLAMVTTGFRHFKH